MKDEISISDSEKKIKDSFNYFLEKYQKSEGFSKEDLFHSMNWETGTFETYFSKIFRPFLKKIGEHYCITEAFRKYSTWKRFRAFFSQSRDKMQIYKEEIYDNVIIYEFFMPLTNESALKSALDSLFYKNTIIRRLKLQSIKDLEKNFLRKSNEDENEYYERICDWISKKFIGFSINHFKGRFRIGDLKTFKEVGIIQEQAGRYIEDETTAIVKFIFPCGEQKEKQTTVTSFIDKEIQQEANLIRYFFEILFIEIIKEVINAEDEIWMLESGMRTSLHIWKIDN